VDEVIARATLADAAELASVAAATFPLACPPRMGADDIAAFLAAQLSETRFAEYLHDPSRVVLKVSEASAIIGYALLVAGEPADPNAAAAVRERPTVELSKFYLLPHHHGSGTAAHLMAAAIAHADQLGARSIWLGVNQLNRRAQRFYAKHGFQGVGTKTFQVGGQVEDDFVFERQLS
jgi:GNAT superfamily N-acetyltransferase